MPNEHIPDSLGNTLRQFRQNILPQIIFTLLGIAPIVISILLGVRLQVSGWWLLAFALLAFCHLEYRGFMVIQPLANPVDQGLPRWQPLANAGWQWLANWGAVELLFVVLIIGVAAALRMMSGLRLGLFLFFSLGYVVIAFRILYFSRGPAATIVKSVAAFMIGPVLWSWFTTSVIQGVVEVVPWAIGTVVEVSHQTAIIGVSRSQDGVAAKTSVQPVAVMLSGGGYRAAAIHAGVLWVLDEAHIPVRILSAVSGGSIIGAEYALGRTPNQFRSFLAIDRPGLPNDLFNFVHFVGNLVVPFWSTADTYEFHFDRVYFRGATLRDTHGPVLVLNATDYATGRRAAFWPRKDGDVPLARLVAASAAFPIAFDPVRVAGVNSRWYSDGGVVENLGVDGLREYLAQEKDAVTPTVLLISDASAEPGVTAGTIKTGWLNAGSHALEAQFASLHERIYDFYTAEDPTNPYNRNSQVPLRQPYRSAADRLWPGRTGQVKMFILSPTSPAERWRFSDHSKLIEVVARLSTLNELSHREVDAAFWAGAKLASDSLPQLCAAVGIEGHCLATLPDPPEEYER
jgi:predicted acylesterase/phospholipase RssA